jgi:molybdopterin synthase catalytic subunit
MVVRIRLFAMLRERAGRDVLELELPDGARVADALTAVGDLAAGLPLVLAVNREYAPPEQPLEAGDELALIPPVSGGAPHGAAPDREPHVAITREPLSVDAVAARVRDPRAGAVVTFQGVTREVDRLDYEAYDAMALEAMRRIVRDAIERHGLCAAAAEHRIGAVALSEPSVVVAVSAPHRGEAFAGAREIIDALKAVAPIWKREVEGDAGRWVDGAPPAVA